MKKIITLLVLISVGQSQLQAQDAFRKNGFGINQDYNDYNVQLLDRKLISFDSSLSSSFRISYGRYLNRKWEFNAGISNGFILNQTQGDHFIKKSYNLGIDVDIVFKLNNSVFMPENSRVAPYLSFGYNFNYMKAFKDAGISPTTLGNEYGFGVKIRIGKRSYINVQTALDQQLSGDFDTHMQYRLGFGQSIGKRTDERDPVPEDQRDYDQDGIADINDNCPTIAGLDSNGGCPVDWVGDGMNRNQEDSLFAKVDTLEFEIVDLLSVIDSLQKKRPFVQVDYPDSDSTIDLAQVDEKVNEGADENIEGQQPGDKPTSSDPAGKSDDPKTTDGHAPDGQKKEDVTQREPVTDVNQYYDRSEIREGYFVVAISTKNPALAERIAVLLDKDYPIVRILPQPTGFYRVGIYATRNRSEAIDILEYTKTHGVPSGWLSFE